MTLEQTDRLLAEWKQKVQCASDNLEALTELITWKRLNGTEGWPRVHLCGVSRSRVIPALDAMQDLWEHQALLLGVVHRARLLRESVSRLLPARRTLDEIEWLLCGPSIKLPPVATPLAERGLLTAAEVAESITAERLLAAMVQSFQIARDAVLDVDAAWDHLVPLLAESDLEIARLQELANTLGEDVDAELATVRQETAALRPLVLEDPLAAIAVGKGVSTVLTRVRNSLDHLAQQRTRLRTQLLEARQLLDHLTTIHREAHQAFAERIDKVQLGGPENPVEPLAADRVAALAPWLATLERTNEIGRWRSAAVGLAKWLSIARGYVASEEACLAANRVPVLVRRDLRGLFEALQAKAQAHGRSEEVELTVLATQVQQLLATRPTPLTELQNLVREYQVRLL